MLVLSRIDDIGERTDHGAENTTAQYNPCIPKRDLFRVLRNEIAKTNRAQGDDGEVKESTADNLSFSTDAKSKSEPKTAKDMKKARTCSAFRSSPYAWL